MSIQIDRETAVHLAEIRRALTRRNAAVMVGAGFSRNAEGGEQFSTWPQVSAELTRRLDPSAKTTEFSTASVTQLGEQFARVFSEPALEDFLKEMVPDERARPGLLHDELLRLEWSEIFTTNYDTLLERAAAKMFERAHFTVCSREDIPLSKVLATRRIVKLHGSFPSQRPFIFTEEQYRTYPEKFAPFVNLVRQSLLENVFCLIGFSGDDPNFLHWLGWVRDMLDGASLPVYLFLTSAPTFGQRSLLLARGVTPVVLPEADSKIPSDYEGRYSKLLAALAEPLTPPALDWGVISGTSNQRSGNQSKDEQYVWLLDQFMHLASLQRTYPGWLIAPRTVRTTLRHQTSSFVETLEGPYASWAHERLNREPQNFYLVILAMYAWQREVLLAPLDDTVAQIALKLLTDFNDQLSDLKTQTAKQRMEAMGAYSNVDTKRHRRDLTISVLRWARQGLRDDAFAKLSELLLLTQDTYAADVVHNERILLFLQRAHRQQARDALASWKVRSADPYMLVRRAVLTAELGDIDGATHACNVAIQHLREGQKIKPRDLQLISQEAWACFLTDRLQQGRNIWVSKTQQDNVSVVDDLSERLHALAARGYSPQRELEQAEAALGAEAMASFDGDLRFKGFEIGAITPVRRVGLPAEFRSKITAAFEWLELAECTGLLPRMPGVLYHSSSYLQAAWWIQYSDSIARVHGILMRTVARDALTPRDPTKPPHRTGWLSRYQVALLSTEQATSACRQLLTEIEDSTSRNADHPDNAAAMAFQLEVFSRFIVRVEPSAAIELGERILQLHQHPALIQDTSNRPRLAMALKHCCESIPSDQVLPFLRLAANYCSSLPAPHDFYHWFLFTELLFMPVVIPTASEQADWRPVVLSALYALEREQTTYTWAVLVALKVLGMLTSDEKQRAATALWQNQPVWPKSSVLHPLATLQWPAPPGIDIRAAFVAWLREQSIARFGVQAPGILRLGLSTKSDNQYFEAVYEGLKIGYLEIKDFEAVVTCISEWWHDEQVTILGALDKNPELIDLLDARLAQVDQVVWEGRRQFLLGAEACLTGLDVRVQTLIDEFAHINRPLQRVSLQDNLVKGEIYKANLQLREIGKAFVGDDYMQIELQADMVDFLIHHIDAYPSANFDLILDALCGAVVARHLPGTLKAMQKLSTTALSRSSLFLERHWRACETALELLETELQYNYRPSTRRIEDDGLPTYRFVCAQLADALSRSGSSVSEAPVVRRWLEEAHSDPLPELRFARFRIPVAADIK